MRVVHVVSNLHDGGMERMVADLAAQHAAEGLDLHVLSLESGGRFAERLGGRVGLHVARRMSKLSMLRPASLAEDLARLQPDVVHVHSGMWFKAARAARMARAGAIVYTEHGRHFPDPLRNRLVDGLGARSTDAVVTVSHALRDHVIGRLRVPRQRVWVILNGIDARDREPGHPRSCFPTPREGAVTFVALGRLHPAKGLDAIVEALRGWPRCAPSARIWIAGEGPARAELERHAVAAGVQGCVEFLGWVSDSTGLLAAADAFLLPSWSEGTSISLLEAMAGGLPPIASTAGGNAHVLGPELAEWLVAPGDVAGLQERMLRLAGSAALRRAIGARARIRVLKNFNLPDMAAAYLRLYRELLGSRSP